MHNSETILRCLDEQLSSNVELTLYGRAALDLTFPDEDRFRGTLDVDVILPLMEISAIDANEGFWNALERTNEILAPRGLYLTHLFPNFFDAARIPNLAEFHQAFRANRVWIEQNLLP